MGEEGCRRPLGVVPRHQIRSTGSLASPAWKRCSAWKGSGGRLRGQSAAAALDLAARELDSAANELAMSWLLPTLDPFGVIAAGMEMVVGASGRRG